MKRMKYAAIICCTVGWILTCSVSAEEAAASKQEHEVQESLESAFEVESEAESEEIEMEKQNEFWNQINEKTREQALSYCVDVMAMEQPSAQQVLEWITAYSMDGYAYLDGAPILPQDAVQIQARRNLEGLKDPIPMQYGIITRNAAVRSFPTWRKLSKALDARAFDYFQESMLLMGEPVAVLHQTADGVWSFVQAGNYNGWVMTEHIGICQKEELCAWVSPETYAVVTDPYVTLEERKFRMGTMLPAEEKEDEICLMVPARDEKGMLTATEISVPQGGAFHMGYLEMTQEAILTQAKKLVDTPYGWGDSNMDMDCSSTMNSIYRCFGVLLPRNTSAMPYTGTTVYCMDEMNAEQKRTLIESLAPGTMLVMNGHVVMYIGQENGISSVLHNVVGFSLDGGQTAIDAYKCCITPLDVRTGSGTSYLDRYRFAITLEEWYH